MGHAQTLWRLYEVQEDLSPVSLYWLVLDVNNILANITNVVMPLLLINNLNYYKLILCSA